MEQKLTRSRSDRVIAGVCGGLGAYLHLDTTLIRIFFVILFLTSGIGVLLYLLLWILIPNQDETATARFDSDEVGRRAATMSNELRDAVSGPSSRARVWIGAAFILLGALLLIQNLNIVWLRWLNFDFLWPLLLVVAGVVLIWRQSKKNTPPTPAPPPEPRIEQLPPPSADVPSHTTGT